MAKPLKVLFVTRRFPPSTGGMELYASELYTALSKEVDVKLLSWGGSNIFLPAVMIYFFIYSCWILSTQKIDVIHMQDGALSVMGRVLKFIFRKPLTVVIHGLDVTYNKYGYQRIVLPALKKADHIFCISNATREEVLKRGVNPVRATFIPIGITDSVHIESKKYAKEYVYEKIGKQAERPKIILSVGRLVKRKGVVWFSANVMPHILKESPNTIFLVSGEGEHRKDIEKIIKEKGLEDKVILLGQTSDEFKKNLYLGADVFVMPNLPVSGDMEGFGLVLLEASLCELPVVASGIEGIKDAIIHQKNGILVPSRDKKSFSIHISSFLNDQQMSDQFGSNSRRFTLLEYNWPNIAKRYVQIYKSLQGVENEKV